MSGKPTVLPSWMYGDPADVAERKEQGEINRAERKAREARVEIERVVGLRSERLVDWAPQPLPDQRRQRYGLVGDETVRLIKRLRVRELVAGVKEDKR